MSDDNFNMSLRKFLKRVGVTSQQQIEDAVRAARADGSLRGKTTVTARMELTLPGLGRSHVVEGEIALAEDA